MVSHQKLIEGAVAILKPVRSAYVYFYAPLKMDPHTQDVLKRLYPASQVEVSIGTTKGKRTSA